MFLSSIDGFIIIKENIHSVYAYHIPCHGKVKPKIGKIETKISVGTVIIKSFEMFITENTSRIAKIEIIAVIMLSNIKKFWLKNKTIRAKTAPVMPEITLFDTFSLTPQSALYG